MLVFAADTANAEYLYMALRTALGAAVRTCGVAGTPEEDGGKKRQKRRRKDTDAGDESEGEEDVELEAAGEGAGVEESGVGDNAGGHGEREEGEGEDGGEEGGDEQQLNAKEQGVRKSGVALYMLHGRLKQRRRVAAFKAFSAVPAPSVLVASDVAARGLDIEAIDWVVMLDPPTDPDQLVHRVGRTARFGASGRALVMLQPNEGEYLSIMKMRDVPATMLPIGPGARKKLDCYATKLANRLRRAALEDRARLDVALKAFVSYVRTYKAHRLHHIFRWRDLDMRDLGRVYALFKLPSMPELRGGNAVEGLELPGHLVGVDVEAIPYASKAREETHRSRQERRAARRAEGPKRSKQNAEREAIKGDKGLSQRGRKRAWSELELGELLEEARALRKMQRGAHHGGGVLQKGWGGGGFACARGPAPHRGRAAAQAAG